MSSAENFHVKKIIFLNANSYQRICGVNEQRGALTLLNSGLNNNKAIVGGNIFYAYRDQADQLESMQIAAGLAKTFDARAIPHGEIYGFSDTAGLVLIVEEGIIRGIDK